MPLYAIDSIRLQVGHWTLDTADATQFDLSVSLTEAGVQLTASTAKLDLPEPVGRVHDLQLRCDELQFNTGQWQCQSGVASFDHDVLGQQQVHFSMTALPGKDHYQLSVSGLRLAESAIRLQANYQASDWTASLAAESLSLSALSQWLPLILNPSQLGQVAQWDYQGRLKLEIKLEGKAGQLQSTNLSWQAAELSFSNASGTQVAENLLLNGKARAKRMQGQWHWQFGVRIDSGQAYSDPVFLDLQQYPLFADARGVLAEDFSSMKIEHAELEHQGILKAEMALGWKNDGLQFLNVKTGLADLTTLYPVWLQPFVVGTALAKLDSKGKVGVDFEWQRASDYQLQLSFDEATLVDQEGRFSLHSLDGQFGWSRTARQLNTSLQWASAKLFEVDLGAAAIQARSANSQLVLNETLLLPVLDGSLEISAFSLDNQSGQLNWEFEGLLMPISMPRLTEALAWPPLDGKLSGVIPTVSYRNGELNIDGALQIKVFDGTMVVRDLRMKTPFGSLPQLYANVDIRNIDLTLLTNAFDFGRITGRIEGYVHQLRLSNWKPVRFDAKLATPENNPGRRRISQKAVDNLTELGGGASGMVSRSFLGFFDEFSYQKLGVSCALRNEVCEMDGIEEAEQGYYIVKGGGGLPPWIHVIGYNRRVDWAELLARLLAIRDSAGPVIE
ncbi:MAG: hypothetical protein Kow0083_11140 [Methylophaga sp.]